MSAFASFYVLPHLKSHLEHTRFFNAFALESDMEGIALKVAMTLPSLMLQKPHAKSKTRDHISCLQTRLNLSLASFQPSKRETADEASTARRFSKMMMEGRVRAALRLLSSDSHTGLLRLDETIDIIRWERLSEMFLQTNTRTQSQHFQKLS